MRLGLIFVLVVGVAMFPTCSAEIGPNDLWKFNSPLEFTAGVQVDQGISLTSGIDEGITLTPGIDKGINLTPGIDKGFTINPVFAAKIEGN